jgi:hypothetical protein
MFLKSSLVQEVDELLMVVKKEIEQEKEAVIRQLAAQEELAQLEKEEGHAKETRSIIYKGINQLYKQSE